MVDIDNLHRRRNDRISIQRSQLYNRVLCVLSAMDRAKAIDWVVGHGLLGLVEAPSTPEWLAADLGPALEQTHAGNLYRIWRFQEIVDALDGLPICPLKGVHLLDTIYEASPSLRPMEDIDLLVPEAFVDLTLARLADRLGARETDESRRLRQVTHQRVLLVDSAKVEIHSRLGLKHGRLSTWTDLRPRRARCHDRDVYVLDETTTLVHLIAHFVKHGPFLRLKWVDDILRCIECGDDHSHLPRRAQKLGAHRTVAAGLRVLRKALGSDLLPGVSDATDPIGRRAIALNERLLWGVRSDLDPSSPVSSSGLRRNLTALLLADHVGDGLRFAWAKARELTRR